MTTGLSAATANAFLDALGNASNYTAPAAIWIQLHTADPGSAGTTAVATNNTRKQASFGAASGGAITTDAALTWTSVAGSEDYTHWSAWTLSSGGTFLCSGTVTANAVTAGDTFTIPTGDLDLSFTTAA